MDNAFGLFGITAYGIIILLLLGYLIKTLKKKQAQNNSLI